MLRIGDFSRLSQVSVKALRFYDEIGLLKPTFVDRTTGYRYYAPTLLSRLNQILACKELGFSLGEIAALLQTDLSDDQVRAVLQNKRAELSRRIAQEQMQLAQVDAWLQQLAVNNDAPEPHIVLKQVPAQWVASVRATIDSYDETEELYAELQHHLDKHRRSGQRAAIWHACAGRSDHIECEVLVLLNEYVPDGNRVRVYELPANTIASVIHQGSDETIEPSYLAARKWIKAHGYSVNGPNRELYWHDSREHSDAKNITEIQFPILITPKPTAAGN